MGVRNKANKAVLATVQGTCDEQSAPLCRTEGLPTPQQTVRVLAVLCSVLPGTCLG